MEEKGYWHPWKGICCQGYAEGLKLCILKKIFTNNIIALQKNIMEVWILNAGVRNKISGEIEEIKADGIMAEIKMRGT